MGIAYALVALVSWGIGDFLIQRSVRKFGDWVPLFYINIAAVVVLLPFVYNDIGRLFSNPRGFLILTGTSIVLLFATIFDFEALRVGKISVVEPVYAFEIPVTTVLATLVIREYLTPLQTLLIVGAMVGIFLVATRSLHHLKRAHLERGVWIAVIATTAMGAVNFLFGVGARETSPILINWFTSLFLGLAAFGYLVSRSRSGEIVAGWRGNKRLLLGMSVVDNLAWVAYSYSTLYIPIAIAIGISESYIALAAGLGLLLNKEKLKTHQFVGFALCVTAVIALAVITDR